MSTPCFLCSSGHSTWDTRKAQADETYQVGIARRAQPLERLESKYREFQKRMMSSPTLPSQADSEEAASSAALVAQTSPKRKALRETKSSSLATTRVTRSSARQASSSTPTTTPALPQTTRPQPNARLQVYVDPSPGDASATAAVEEEVPSAWPELGSRKSRVKENIKEASKAAGTTLPQAGRAQRAAAAQRTSKIDVYRDPAPDDANEDDVPAGAEPTAASPPPPRAAPKTKAGKAIEVFCEEAPDATPAAAPPSKSKVSKKSAIPVFRDDVTGLSSAIAAPTKISKPRGTNKSSIPVFRDQDAPPDPAPAPTKASKGKTKSTIPVLRDEPGDDAENQPASKPAAGSLKGKSKIAVFRDDGLQQRSAPGKKATKSKIAVFRDEDAQEPSTSDTKTKNRISIFRDDDASGSATKANGKTPVFRDPEPAPSKPKIAVFRDEDAAEPPPIGKKDKSKVSIFCDEDAQEHNGSSKPKSEIPFRDADLECDAPALPKAETKFAVIQDEDAAESSGATPKAKGKMPVFRDPEPAPSKPRTAVFRDEEPTSTTTPAFTPYRDEEVRSARNMRCSMLIAKWRRYHSRLRSWAGPGAVPASGWVSLVLVREALG